MAAEIRPGIHRPDLSVVTRPAAREALLGRDRSRFGLADKWNQPLEPTQDRVWRTVLELFARSGRPPGLHEISTVSWRDGHSAWRDQCSRANRGQLPLRDGYPRLHSEWKQLPLTLAALDAGAALQLVTGDRPRSRQGARPHRAGDRSSHKTHCRRARVRASRLGLEPLRLSRGGRGLRPPVDRYEDGGPVARGAAPVDPGKGAESGVRRMGQL
jgi:hypothetical protein